MMDTAAPPGQRRRRRWVVALLIVLLLLGAYTALDAWAGRRVRIELADVEGKLGRLNEQKTLLVAPVPSADNRARVVRAAAALTVRQAGSTHINLPASSPVPASLRAFAEANAPAIRLAGEIGTRRQSSWDIEYEYNGERPPLEDIRTLSDAIYVAAVVALEDGRLDDASRLTASGLAVAASMRQEPDLITQLIRIAIVNRHIGIVQRVVTQTESSKASLDDLARWLAENRTPDPMERALAGELKMVNTIFAQMENGIVDPMIVSYIYPESWPSWLRKHVGLAARIGRPIVRMARARYLEQMQHLMEVQRGARPRPAFAARVKPARWAVVDRLVDKFIAGIVRSIETGDDFNSELGAAEAAVALRRYKLDRGTYPDDLAALVPAHVVSLASDPYTGRPPVYARQGDGFTLRAGSPGVVKGRWWVLEWKVVK